MSRLKRWRKRKILSFFKIPKSLSSPLTRRTVFRNGVTISALNTDAFARWLSPLTAMSRLSLWRLRRRQKCKLILSKTWICRMKIFSSRPSIVTICTTKCAQNHQKRRLYTAKSCKLWKICPTVRALFTFKRVNRRRILRRFCRSMA